MRVLDSSGRDAGEICRQEAGLYTVFSYRGPLQPEVCRLWLTGGDGSFPLGVPTPGGGGLTLEKRLSRKTVRPWTGALLLPLDAQPGQEEKPEKPGRLLIRFPKTLRAPRGVHNKFT
ncbi:MAG: hypothetical protein II794_00590 [Oscillospiraceae bacterium]|nr:hypothetical protein [Oscillospiraceae bacterium]